MISRLPIYQPPSAKKILWLRVRLLPQRLKLALSKIGVLPAYLGEDVRWSFVFRHARTGASRERYAHRLARFAREWGPTNGFERWKALRDPRPIEDQPPLTAPPQG